MPHNPVRRLSEADRELCKIKLMPIDYKGYLAGINCQPNSKNTKRIQLPENSGLYQYDIRHSDEDWGEPATLEKYVLVNWYGRVISDKEFKLPENNGEYDIINYYQYKDKDSSCNFRLTNDYYEFDELEITAYDLQYHKDRVINMVNSLGLNQYDEYGNCID